MVITWEGEGGKMRGGGEKGEGRKEKEKREGRD
jgi:hypothetical protein